MQKEFVVSTPWLTGQACIQNRYKQADPMHNRIFFLC